MTGGGRRRCLCHCYLQLLEERRCPCHCYLQLLEIWLEWRERERKSIGILRYALTVNNNNNKKKT